MDVGDNMNLTRDQIFKHLQDIITDLEFQADVNNVGEQDQTEFAQLARETRVDILAKIVALKTVIDRLNLG